MATIVNVYHAETSGDPLNIVVSAVGSGNDVVVAVRVADSRQPVTATDNRSNTYTQISSYVDDGGSGDIFFFLAENITNAPTQVSLDYASSGSHSYAIWEISGLDASPYIAGISPATGTSTTPSASFTTTTDSEVALAYLQVANGTTITGTNGFTAREFQAAPSSFGAGLDDNDVGTAGAKTVSASLGSSLGWKLGGIRLRNAVAATGSSNKRLLLGVG